MDDQQRAGARQTGAHDRITDFGNRGIAAAVAMGAALQRRSVA